MKKFIAKFFGTRKPTKDRDLSQVRSVLLNPVGDAVGDAVAHSLHIKQLKEAYPNLKVGVLVTDRNIDVFKAANVVDEFIYIKPINFVKNWKKWDLYLDFSTRFNSKSLILDKILSPNRVMIFIKTPKRYYSLDNIHNYDFYRPLDKLVHFKDYLHHSDLSPYLNQDTKYYSLFISKLLKEKLDQFWSENKIRILVFPQGSYIKRRLSVKECGDILSSINTEYLNKIEIKFGYSKYNEEYLNELTSLYPHLGNIKSSERTTVAEYLALIDSADIILAVDSGSVHVSCALQKRLLAFYANHSENLAKWRPHSKNMVNTLMITSQHIAASSDETFNFDIGLIQSWLNNQITDCIKNKAL